MTQSANLIGARVRKARLSKTPKITQLKLATLLQLEGIDVDQAQISKLENGTRPVRDIELVMLAKILGVSASWLLNETDSPKRLN